MLLSGFHQNVEKWIALLLLLFVVMLRQDIIRFVLGG